jgi:hypothetical protein
MKVYYTCITKSINGDHYPPRGFDLATVNQLLINTTLKNSWRVKIACP